MRPFTSQGVSSVPRRPPYTQGARSTVQSACQPLTEPIRARQCELISRHPRCLRLIRYSAPQGGALDLSSGVTGCSPRLHFPAAPAMIDNASGA